MKLWPATKPDKRNTGTSKGFDDVMLANSDVIVFLSIYGQFAATRKPDSGHMVNKTYIFINNSLLSLKNWKHLYAPTGRKKIA